MPATAGPDYDDFDPIWGPFPDTVTGRVLDALGPAFRRAAGSLLPALVAGLVVELEATDTLLSPVIGVPGYDDTLDGLDDTATYEDAAEVFATYEAVEDLTTGDVTSWAAAFDLDGTTDPGWLGLVTGQPVPSGLSTTQERDFIRARSSWRRGTPAVLVSTIGRYLNGTQTVELLERTSSPWRASLRVYSEEIKPGQEQLLRDAAAAAKPVGIRLDVHLADGVSYDHFTTEHGPAYSVVTSEFGTYADMTSHKPYDD
ncbi:hypothetical protein [Nocardioides sp. GY 10127]|uniref:hypothetical protein n=1 Tax=Nocardioides sp. GY 10127 TaxID=2569762 RepID=UPI0010A771D0|nr:hypothetical protein [Nocardioides sp. GY 10127]TIC78771.1 hypothetical protein E8D37_18925 [Nocardioides sp. GY 10127]